MTLPVRPMLAVTAPTLKWPRSGFWVQPKFDGVGCLIDPALGPVTLSGQPIPCPAVRDALSHRALIGLHGELTAPGGLEAAQSAFMGSGQPPADWRFTAFDDLTAFSRPFEQRLARLRSKDDRLPDFALISPARHAATAAEAPEAFAAVVADQTAQDGRRHLDGLILRSPEQPYREGRASAYRGEAIKLKPSDEGEAEVLDVSARRDDQTAVGALQVRSAAGAVWVPAALPRDAARALWAERDSLPGRPATLRWWGLTSRGGLRNAIAVSIRRDRAA